MGLVPGAGDAAGKALKAPETALKKGDVAEASGLLNEGSEQISAKAKDVRIWTETRRKFPVSNAYRHWSKHKQAFPEYQNSKQYADVGRNLTLTSEQDSDRSEMKQQSVSVPVGGAGGSVSLNASRDRMHSDYDSVQQQTGILPGKADLLSGWESTRSWMGRCRTGHEPQTRLLSPFVNWYTLHESSYRCFRSGV